jgi:hypothetical protein
MGFLTSQLRLYGFGELISFLLAISTKLGDCQVTVTQYEFASWTSDRLGNVTVDPLIVAETAPKQRVC